MDYVTISTLGNALDFGELVNGAIIIGGTDYPVIILQEVFSGGGSLDIHYYRNTIDYITIATEGDAIDFGDLTTATTRRWWVK